MRNFLIVAPPGSGTTWLANFLNYSPDVLVYHEGINGCRSLDEYKEKMSKPGYKVIGDVTTASIIASHLKGAVNWEGVLEFGRVNLWEQKNALSIMNTFMDYPMYADVVTGMIRRYEILRNFRVTDPMENMDYEAAKQLLNSLNLGVDNSQE